MVICPLVVLWRYGGLPRMRTLRAKQMKTKSMEEVGVLGRYQGPRTAQLDAETLATVTSDTKGGVSVILTPIAELA